jgi:hypothetical protein
MKAAIPITCLALPLLIAAAVAATAAQDTPSSSTSGAITEIVLDRPACHGSCPVDTLVLRSNGKAEYTGRKNTRLIGDFAGPIPPGDFDRLAHWLVTEGFFQMERKLDAVVTSDSDVVIRVTRDGKSKSIVSQSSLQSLQMWGMANLIRSVAADIQWQPAHSGIRGQLLMKQPGKEWMSQPDETIWVTPAGTQDMRWFQADGQGRFEINLAPGTYTVTWRLSGPSTVVVEPDQFTEANLQLDVAARNGASQFRDPPPPPEDGLYTSSSGTAGNWMVRVGADEYRLGVKSGLTILEKRIVAEGPDNSLFRLALTVPYDENKASTSALFSLFLVVGDTAYRTYGTTTRGTDSPLVYFQIPGEEQAKSVARLFDIPLRRFSRPDYKLSVSLTPTRQSFKRGEAITARLRVVNNGSDFIQFRNLSFGSKRDDYTFTARRNGQPVTDISFIGDRGGTSSLESLAPGTTFEDTVNLGKWFDFTESGSYEVQGSYTMNIRYPRNTDTGLASWTEYAKSDLAINIE